VEGTDPSPDTERLLPRSFGNIGWPVEIKVKNPKAATATRNLA